MMMVDAYYNVNLQEMVYLSTVPYLEEHGINLVSIQELLGKYTQLNGHTTLHNPLAS